MGGRGKDRKGRLPSPRPPVLIAHHHGQLLAQTNGKQLSTMGELGDFVESVLGERVLVYAGVRIMRPQDLGAWECLCWLLVVAPWGGLAL